MSQIENSEPVKKPRGNPAWSKGGASPNPGGRPRAVAELLELARSDVPEAFALARSYMRDVEMDPRTRLDAAKFIVSYGIGKPPAFEGAESDTATSQNLANVTPEQLLSVVRATDGGTPEH